ncbi:hypothetical protein G8B49_01695 [Enterococcus mundtii]|uniref:hypothetical protein n=1 Tax=Enterococcus mundtii TaxID=53346 RepID=UPI001883A1D4|nr:hypothetical protein [Enterococcus mundtii]MBE9909973.1 hypothetical protein [Enterococcus mundtii]
MLQFLINVLSAIGILTLINMFLYFLIGQDYQYITVKELKHFNFENPYNDDIYAKYTILRTIDLDPHKVRTNHIALLIGPEEKNMTKIKFKFIKEYDNKKNEYITDNFDYDNSNPIELNLSPQNYIIIIVPTTESLPNYLMEFKVDYQIGEYIFTKNMNSGINDRVTIPTKRTLLSFLSK